MDDGCAACELCSTLASLSVRAAYQWALRKEPTQVKVWGEKGSRPKNTNHIHKNLNCTWEREVKNHNIKCILAIDNPVF